MVGIKKIMERKLSRALHGRRLISFSLTCPFLPEVNRDFGISPRLNPLCTWEEYSFSWVLVFLIYEMVTGITILRVLWRIERDDRYNIGGPFRQSCSFSFHPPPGFCPEHHGWGSLNLRLRWWDPVCLCVSASSSGHRALQPALSRPGGFSQQSWWLWRQLSGHFRTRIPQGASDPKRVTAAAFQRGCWRPGHVNNPEETAPWHPFLVVRSIHYVIQRDTEVSNHFIFNRQSCSLPEAIPGKTSV